MKEDIFHIKEVYTEGLYTYAMCGVDVGDNYHEWPSFDYVTCTECMKEAIVKLRRDTDKAIVLLVKLIEGTKS